MSFSASVDLAQSWRILPKTVSAWSSDKIPRLGAALAAYYRVLSIVPLLVVIIAIIGLIFGEEAAQGYILQEISSVLGPQCADALKDMATLLLGLSLWQLTQGPLLSIGSQSHDHTP